MLHDVHRRRRRLAITLGVAAAATALAPAAAAVSPVEAVLEPPAIGSGDAPAPAPSPAPSVAGLVAGTPVAVSAGDCRGGGAHAARARRATLKVAVMCLVNRERGQHGLRPLKRDRRLARAAGRHARDMVRRDYFAHQRTGGPDLGARLRRAGWRGSASGETIAYGCGGSGTARATVSAWLDSPAHRALLLSGTYGRGGPGVAKGTPTGCGGATWVLDLGRP